MDFQFCAWFNLNLSILAVCWIVVFMGGSTLKLQRFYEILIVILFFFLCYTTYFLNSFYGMYTISVVQPEHEEATVPTFLEPPGPLYVMLKVTAYNPVLEQTDDTPHEAAWGDKVARGMVAVSWDLIKLGLDNKTPIVIDGLEFMQTTISDKMHERKIQQLDILMFSEPDAWRFGVQYRRVQCPLTWEAVNYLFEHYRIRMDCYDTK